MQVVHAADLAWSEKEERHREGGLAFKNLFRGENGDPNNFRLVLSRNAGEYQSPHHRHNFDQIRFCVSGPANIAPGKTLEEGDIGYFPEGAFYGPQHDHGRPRVTLVMQFGGASGLGYMSSDQLRRGTEELEALGTFGGGRYRRHGAEGDRDSYEAIWEHVFQRPIAYPPARYTDPLLIRPAAFEWRADRMLPGVRRKDLGSFTERPLKLAFVALDPGAVMELGESNAMTLVFVMEGEGACGQGAWKQHSAFRLDDEDRLALQAATPTQALVICAGRL